MGLVQERTGSILPAQNRTPHAITTSSTLHGQWSCHVKSGFCLESTQREHVVPRNLYKLGVRPVWG